MVVSVIEIFVLMLCQNGKRIRNGTDCGKPAADQGAAAPQAEQESVSPGLQPRKTLDSFRNAADAAVQERENGLREADQYLSEQ